jgi:hypothetical protein
MHHRPSKAERENVFLPSSVLPAGPSGHVAIALPGLLTHRWPSCASGLSRFGRDPVDSIPGRPSLFPTPWQDAPSQALPSSWSTVPDPLAFPPQYAPVPVDQVASERKR